MLHRLRSVLVRPGREHLSGIVEVDETFVGGEEPGLRGGPAKGKKVLVGVAVELKQPKGYGRCRMATLLELAVVHEPVAIATLSPTPDRSGTRHWHPAVEVIHATWSAQPPAGPGELADLRSSG